MSSSEWESSVYRHHQQGETFMIHHDSEPSIVPLKTTRPTLQNAGPSRNTSPRTIVRPTPITRNGSANGLPRNGQDTDGTAQPSTSQNSRLHAAHANDTLHTPRTQPYSFGHASSPDQDFFTRYRLLLLPSVGVAVVTLVVVLVCLAIFLRRSRKTKNDDQEEINQIATVDINPSPFGDIAKNRVYKKKYSVDHTYEDVEIVGQGHMLQSGTMQPGKMMGSKQNDDPGDNSKPFYFALDETKYFDPKELKNAPEPEGKKFRFQTTEVCGKPGLHRIYSEPIKKTEPYAKRDLTARFSTPPGGDDSSPHYFLVDPNEESHYHAPRPGLLSHQEGQDECSPPTEVYDKLDRSLTATLGKNPRFLKHGLQQGEDCATTSSADMAEVDNQCKESPYARLNLKNDSFPDLEHANFAPSVTRNDGSTKILDASEEKRLSRLFEGKGYNVLEF